MNDEAVKWLREQAAQRMETAKAVPGPPWREDEGGCCVIGDGLVLETSCQVPTWPDERTLTVRHVVANDPQDVIAGCEAELAILDEYEARGKDVNLMLGPDVLRQREWSGLRLAVELLASGYRHRPGYAEHWGEVTQQSLQQSGT